jgi:hypothetical protein
LRIERIDLLSLQKRPYYAWCDSIEVFAEQFKEPQIETNVKLEFSERLIIIVTNKELIFIRAEMRCIKVCLKNTVNRGVNHRDLQK